MVKPTSAPSILSAGFARPDAEGRPPPASAGWIHVDVMDGRFGDRDIWLDVAR